MDVIILGCGTSIGVPALSCDCAVCMSDNPRNKRLRTSAAVRLDEGHTILIDTGPDLRQQALVNGLSRLDAIFYTHTHADHVHGIDEIRMYNYLQRRPMDIYGIPEHIGEIKQRFAYIFEPSIQKGGGKPNITPHIVTPGKAFELFGTPVVPITIQHGQLPCLGWRIGNFAYLTDVSHIPDESYPLLEDLDLLVLGALRYAPHSTHFNVDEAVKEAQRIAAKRCYLTHMNHELDYDELCRKLPPSIRPAYDTLRLTL